MTISFLAACGGEEILGPPDGAACTAGPIAAGDSVTGTVTSTSCEVFDPVYSRLTSAESWTLHMAKNTAYVVRLRHQALGAVPDNWSGNLLVFGRNAQGDVNFLTGWWGSFGTPNSRGGLNEELYLVSPTDRTVSLRVTARTSADTGAYSLVVRSCPLTALTAPADTARIDLSLGCESLGVDPLPTRLSFWVFSAARYVPNTTEIHRTLGTGSFRSRVASPAFDIGHWTQNYVGAGVAFDTTASLTLAPWMPGPVAGWLAVRSDSAATVSLSINATAPTPAPDLMPVGTGRIVGRHQGGN